MTRILNLKFNVSKYPNIEDIDEACKVMKKQFAEKGEDVLIAATPVDTDADAGLFDSTDSHTTLKIKKRIPEARLPERMHPGDIGADVYCTSVEYDAEHDRYIYHTGLSIEVPSNYSIHAYPRSSNTKAEAYLPNSVGNIDCNYRGEVLIIYKNRTSYNVECMLAEWEYMKKATQNIQFHNDASIGETVAELKSNMVEPFVMPDPMDFAPYKVGERVCQLVVVKKVQTDIIEVNELSESDRGDGGFGSTGK